MNKKVENVSAETQAQDFGSSYVHHLQDIDLETIKDIDTAMQLLKRSRDKVKERAVLQNKKILLIEGILKVVVVILLTTGLINFIGHLTESAISLPMTVIFFCIFIFCISLYPLRKMYHLKSGTDQETAAYDDIFNRLQKLRDEGNSKKEQHLSGEEIQV